MHEHSQLSNSVRQLVRQALSELSFPKIYLISSYDGKCSVKVNVSFDPTVPPVESNWMPLGGIGVGNGWGFAIGPQIGDQVMCTFENGDFNSGVVIARIFSTAAQPMAVPTGEIWAVHQTGSFLKFVTNGDVDINTAGNLNATVAGNMASTVTGTASITAPTINFGASGQTVLDLVTSAFEALFNNHTHSSGGSGIPNQQMTSSHMTSTVKGA